MFGSTLRNRFSVGASLTAAGVLFAAAGAAFAQNGADVPLVERMKRAQGLSQHLAQPGADECDSNGVPIGCGKSCALLARAANGGVIADEAGGFADREAFTATDLLTVDLDIEVVPSTSTISGSNTMTVKSLQNGLTQFTFVLRNNFTVSQVIVDGTVLAAGAISGPPANSYRRTVTLPRAYNANEVFTIKVVYSGVAVSRGFGSIEFGTQNGQPLVATLSEAYYAATWWPVKDGDVFLPGDNGDKSVGSIAVTVPNGLRAVSNGLLTSTTSPAAGKTRYRWTTNYPTSTYLWAIGITNYNTWTQMYTYPASPFGGAGGTMPVEFNIYPADDTPANRAAWDLCLQMMAAYREPFGEYPFINEKYGMYQFPFSGGMEHQTNTGQGGFWESVTAHELGHQWWGDNVTCKTWNHIWLNEGFATYSEAIWEERKPGSSGLPALHAAMAARRPSAMTDTVYVPDASIANMNRIFSSTYSYRKGGWALHMLRGVVGDENFFNALRSYRVMYQGGGATTEDFKAVCEAVSGRDLTAFFGQWIYGIGAPTYAFGLQPVTIDGAPYARVSLRQTQDTSFGVSGVFSMPVEVVVARTAGSSVSAKVENAALTQQYLIPLGAGGTASSVVIDPSNWIFTNGKTSEAYVAGAAKVVSMTPQSAANDAPLSVKSLRVRFSDPISLNAGVSVIGANGPVPFTATVSEGGTLATLTFAAVLPHGAYTLTIPNATTAGTGTNAGLALDGEYVVGGPSGDGLAGGSYSAPFVVSGNACDPLDFNGDSNIDPTDVDAYFSVLGEGPCQPLGTVCADLDFNNDGNIDPTDVDAYFSILGEGPCVR